MSTPGLPPTPAAEAVVYGIPNCDTVKKARSWLAEHGVAYRFHDFKKQGVPADRLASWIAAAGWDKVLNRQGTTWRKLPADEQAAVRDAASAAALLQREASAIKRPVVEWPGGAITVGFVPDDWATRAG
ncbi:MAG: arsenate reductase [Ottowia sp.]|nr:arsenate reductase [Ottowia sp.]